MTREDVVRALEDARVTLSQRYPVGQAMMLDQLHLDAIVAVKAGARFEFDQDRFAALRCVNVSTRTAHWRLELPSIG